MNSAEGRSAGGAAGSRRIVVTAPGRVNLIGDHTDYTQGLCFPMAIDLCTTIVGEVLDERVELTSATEDHRAVVEVRRRIPADGIVALEPSWARYVAGVVETVRPQRGLRGEVSTTIPIGAGLSSSAALEVAVALALGFEGSAERLAALCQQAEHLATGVPTGILDQLASASGQTGHAMMLDCSDGSIAHVQVPSDLEVVVVHSGQARQLAASGYHERVRQCRRAEELVGPLRSASLDDVRAITDPVIAARARHVVTENQRVRDFAAALATGDHVAAGAVMTASHASLRDDYESSHPVVDRLVDELLEAPGVLGARITGGGFGGCVVALCGRGGLRGVGWHVRPAAGAHRVVGADL